MTGVARVPSATYAHECRSSLTSLPPTVLVGTCAASSNKRVEILACHEAGISISVIVPKSSLPSIREHLIRRSDVETLGVWAWQPDYTVGQVTLYFGLIGHLMLAWRSEQYGQSPIFDHDILNSWPFFS